VDSRFTYCAVSSLSLLGKAHLLNREAIVANILDCLNFDGSFGGIKGAESHAAYVFCSVGTLKILNALDRIDLERLTDWLV
jgi:geranylgeranyl transferase type-2 subunit beta